MNPTDSFHARRALLGWLACASACAAFPTLGCAGAAPCPAANPVPSPMPTPTQPSAPALPPGLLAEDLKLLASPGDALPVVQRTAGSRGVLRSLARPLAPADDVTVLERRMRASLAATKGVGIAAPQVGLGVRAILVMHGARPSTPGGVADPRIVFYLNPRIVERSDEVTLDYEGCLSVAEVCGMVRRNRSVVVEHGVAGAKPVRVEATGFDARIFQHEIDHLEGVLYIDRVEGGLQPKDKLKELREQLRRDHPELVTMREVVRSAVL
ncbi:MAG: peptide deformylase [Deltaproteobacteria bacterium]|nr:peptide deformylase [Deltaproteobacteria bacterium]